MELGIKGHETRGDEVVKILETLGGKNHYKLKLTGDDENHFYYITNHYKDINNSHIGPNEIKGYEIFSLDDFLKKFPYKVGDKVNVWVNYESLSGPRAELEVAEIKSMRWNSARSEIAYKMKDITKEFYKNDIKGKVDDNTNKVMRNKLAIKGHSTRGKEVIKILETLGGKNHYKLNGVKHNYFYYIGDKFKNITNSYIGPDEIKGYEIFSLDDFLKKYPFKVGDRVRIPEYESEVRIDKMYWDGYEIQYEVYTDEVETYSAEELNQWNESNNKSKTKMNNTQESLLKKNSITISSLCYEDEVELNFSCEYDLIERNGKHILIKKKPKYPKTHAECCEVIGYGGIISFAGLADEEENLYGNFIVLKRCRDAYWKIAGEQMGLGKPWKPVWDESEDLYTIHTFNGEIRLSGTSHRNAILVFPTEEMRDMFYENFKELIEQCKELL